MVATGPAVREFGREQRAASDANDVDRRRHAEWRLYLADEGNRLLLRPKHRLWQARLKGEDAIVRGALAWLGGQGDVEAAGWSAASIWRFWWFQEFFGHGQTGI